MVDNPLGQVVNKKIVIYITLAIFSYILLAGSIMHFYQDNPSHMELVDRQEFNLRYLAGLANDKPIVRQDVVNYLGSPDITEAKEVDNVVYQVMFYRTQNITGDGMTTKDECTAMLFIDDQLIAWGDNAYKQYKAY